MKNITITLAILFITLSANAQENSTGNNEKATTLFGQNKEVKLGWFVGLDNGYTQFDKRDVYMSGLNAGLIINHNYTIGFSASGWTNRNTMYYSNIADTTGAYLEGGFGRFLFEYTMNPQSLIHLTFPLMIGAGGASYVTDNDYDNWENEDWNKYHNTIETDLFFSIEPGVRAELNVFKFMRLNAGVSYRYVSGLELKNTSADMMNNFSATVGLKFGKF